MSIYSKCPRAESIILGIHMCRKSPRILGFLSLAFGQSKSECEQLRPTEQLTRF